MNKDNPVLYSSLIPHPSSLSWEGQSRVDSETDPLDDVGPRSVPGLVPGLQQLPRRGRRLAATAGRVLAQGRGYRAGSAGKVSANAAAGPQARGGLRQGLPRGEVADQNRGA